MPQILLAAKYLSSVRCHLDHRVRVRRCLEMCQFRVCRGWVTDLDRSLALACFLEQVGPFQLARFIGLPVHGDSVEGVFEGLTRAGIDHAGLEPLASQTSHQKHFTYLDTGCVLVDVCNESDLGSVEPQFLTCNLAVDQACPTHLLPSPPSSSNSTS